MSRLFAPVDLGRCADVLDELGGDIECLAHRLCDDPLVLANHLTELQDFDRIVQFVRALAQVLRADLCSHELSRTGLDELIAQIGHHDPA